ncbi:MAG: enoyl-ACP reductase [Terracidiphilus sp.]
MINLAGKTAVVFGLANKRSIAWGIAQKLHEAGATLAICYQNDRMRMEAQSLIDELPGASGFQCDVSNDAEIDTLFASLKDKFSRLDILVHAVAFAPAAELRGDFINTSREGFRTAMDVSVYSLIAVTRGAAPLMTEGGSIMTLSFYAAEKVVPNYNVMAIAKAGLESTVLSGIEPRLQEYPRQRHLRRPHQDAGRPRRRRPDRNAEIPRRARPAAP